MLGLVGLVFLVGAALSAPGYRGPVADNFDGTRFRNPYPPHRLESRPPGALFLGNRAAWEPRPDGLPGPAPPARCEGVELRATWVGHATVLLQVAGRNLLTDPIWSPRCSPFSWLGPRRATPPGLRLEELPPLDAILISHNHYDHLDLPTLRRILRGQAPRLVVPLGVGATLQAAGLAGSEELDWWQTLDLGGGVRIHAVPAQHFSSRGFLDRDRTLWCGYVVEAPGGPLYFAGDTGWGGHFQDIRDRFGPMRLALLPIGAFQPPWMMRPVHIDPPEALRAHLVLGARVSLPIHHATFPLGADGQDQPRLQLEAAVAAASMGGTRFEVAPLGRGLRVPPLGGD